MLERTILLIASILIISGCSSTSYYLQGVKGHIALMSQRQPLTQVLEDKKVSAKRKQQLRQVQSMRRFAYEVLKLPQNASYSSFVELEREAISWNLIATPKYSVKPLQTCFPFTGCVSYLVYFSEKRASREAFKHQKAGHDTHIIASPAYSTLGFFADPVVSTMFRGGITATAETLFHELAHQKLYRKNDSAFNEAFASAVGQEGTRLWLKQYHPEKLPAYEEHLNKRWQFFSLLLDTRSQLKDWYAVKKPDDEMERGKQRIIQELHAKYARLKKSWGGDKRFDRWFKRHPMNNAKLAAIGVYYQQVPQFIKTLKSYDYDFDKFYQYYVKTVTAKAVH